MEKRKVLKRRLINFSKFLPCQIGLETVIAQQIPSNAIRRMDSQCQMTRSAEVTVPVDWLPTDEVAPCFCLKIEHQAPSSDKLKPMGDHEVEMDMKTDTLSSIEQKSSVLCSTSEAAVKTTPALSWTIADSAVSEMRSANLQPFAQMIGSEALVVTDEESSCCGEPLDLSCRKAVDVETPKPTPDISTTALPASVEKATKAVAAVSSSPESIQTTPYSPILTCKTPKRAYTEQQMQMALAEIDAGRLGTRRAASLYGIPRSTLRNKISRKSAERLMSNAVVNPVSGASVTTGTTTTPQPATSVRLPQPVEVDAAACAQSEISDSTGLALQLMRNQLLELALTRGQSQILNHWRPSPNPVPPTAANIINMERTNFWQSFVQQMCHERLRMLPVDSDVCSEYQSQQQQDASAHMLAPHLSIPETVSAPLTASGSSYGSEQHTPLSPIHPAQGSIIINNNNISYKSGRLLNKHDKTTGQTFTNKGSRPKRGKYRNYNRDNLASAMKAVLLGEMSVHRAGNMFGVPHSTLEYKVKHRHLDRHQRTLLVLPSKPKAGIEMKLQDGTTIPTQPATGGVGVPMSESVMPTTPAETAHLAPSTLTSYNVPEHAAKPDIPPLINIGVTYTPAAFVPPIRRSSPDPQNGGLLSGRGEDLTESDTLTMWSSSAPLKLSGTSISPRSLTSC